MARVARIRRIEFANFKALSRYSLNLSEINILVGPNNSGKSTAIGALRTLDAAIRFARSRPPTRVYIGETAHIGYRIPNESVPISLENVHSEYDNVESRVTFVLSNNNSLHLVFPEDGGCVLLPDADGKLINSAALFKREFPISLVIVPVLGPVEHREKRRERETIVSGLATHRASRHFRNYWYYFPDGFSDFSELVAKTWPGMEISAPEYDATSGELSMFCLEDRMTREMYWVGFGFQIWCQLITHLSRATENSLVVVDEPEVYLHPDVQRQMLSIIRDAGADVLLATHSSEIIAEADPSEIVIIDKRRKSGERLKNIDGVQRALEAIGSSQNITLTALAKSRRILFVEGLDDFRLLRRIARRNGMHELSSGVGITPLASGGFRSWQRITILAAGIEEALGSPLMIGAIYDRDYFCDEEIQNILSTLGSSLHVAKILERKEIENYLLVPATLDRAIIRGIGKNRDTPPTTAGNISESLLREITDPMKSDVLSQLMARRNEFLRKKGEDESTIYKVMLGSFETRWANIDTRMAMVPGKEVLRQFRQRIQDTHGVTLTDARIVDAMNRDEIPSEMATLLRDLDQFRVHPPKSNNQN
ncbi:AAA family ATPase [Aminobacter aminovorans]|uniref:ATP-dependent nuclease n=1 Tax=Aminobacter aminovorans TaxID=83263 RepID=UPI002860F5BD|nr:AAA family ATPase [Aminobacter aminovorans]MDR7224366.1 energy-coupling factor transporter ATP-binding protein EcfA2 [Aminobacter aminovorans]